MLKLRFSVFLFLVLHTSLGIAQKLLEESLGIKDRYTVQYWKTEDGLPQNTVLSVTQARDGSIWLLTYSGVSSFDGNRFITYNESNNPLFKGLRLSAVGTSSLNGNPLIYSNADVLEFDLRSRSFSKHLINNEVRVLDTDGGSAETYVAGSKGGIYVEDVDGAYRQLGNLKSRITSLIYKRNKLWIGCDRGLFVYDKNKITRVNVGLESDSSCLIFVRQYIYPHQNSYSTLRIGAIASVSEDVLTFYKTCDSRHVYQYNTVTGALNSFAIDPPLGNIRSMVHDEKKNLTWIATDKGLFYKEQSGKAFVQIPHIKDECYSIFQDQEQNIWVGSKNGLYLLKPKLFHTYSGLEGLSPDGIGAVVEDRGKIYIANSACGGLFILQNGQLTRHKDPQLQKICAWSLYKDQRGRIYVGGGYGLLYRITGERVERITLPESCKDASVLCMYEDRSGTLWMGIGAGLYTMDASGVVKPYKGIAIHGEVLQLFPDSKGRLWLGTSNQLAMLEAGKWTDLSRQSGLKVNYIRSFYEDVDHNVWIGTRGEGLVKFKEGKFDRYSEMGSLFDSDVWCITEDDQGYLWMSSNHGITAIRREDLINLKEGKSVFVTVKHFDRTDGMLSTEFNGGFMPTCLKSGDGRLWFPGVKGLTVVNPALVDFEPLSVPITIDKILVDGQEIQLLGDTTITTRLKPGRIEIVYTSPLFGHQKDIFFQTGLDGYDANWSNPTQGRSATFQNLPSGEYTFRVRLYGNYNKEINREASLNLIVPMPLWENPAFITVIAIIVLVISIGIAVYRIRRIRRQTEERRKIEKQFAGLELKALQSQMNPHFIFNCLNSIKYFISIHDEVSAAKYLQAFSKLLRKFLEQSDNNVISLTEEIELIQLYIELQQMRFTLGFEYEIKADGISDPRKIKIPTMLIQPFVENAIIHGFIPLEGQSTKLVLSFSLEEGRLCVLIIDDGVGRKVSAKRSNASGKSMGLAITQGRIDLLNYFNSDPITIETFDTFTDGRLHSGTTVRIIIPVNQAQDA